MADYGFDEVEAHFLLAQARRMRVGAGSISYAGRLDSQTLCRQTEVTEGHTWISD
jgi:hypothetical protein